MLAEALYILLDTINKLGKRANFFKIVRKLSNNKTIVLSQKMQLNDKNKDIPYNII